MPVILAPDKFLISLQHLICCATVILMVIHCALWSKVGYFISGVALRRHVSNEIEMIWSVIVTALSVRLVYSLS
jgi:hypothetical protein